jgi:hypothetical protein
VPPTEFASARALELAIPRHPISPLLWAVAKALAPALAPDRPLAVDWAMAWARLRTLLRPPASELARDPHLVTLSALAVALALQSPSAVAVAVAMAKALEVPRP